jgi:hypothetical protein
MATKIYFYAAIFIIREYVSEIMMPTMEYSYREMGKEISAM